MWPLWGISALVFISNCWLLLQESFAESAHKYWLCGFITIGIFGGVGGNAGQKALDVWVTECAGRGVGIRVTGRIGAHN